MIMTGSIFVIFLIDANKENNEPCISLKSRKRVKQFDPVFLGVTQKTSSNNKVIVFFVYFCLIKKSIGTSIIISEQVFYLNCPLYFSLFDWRSLFHVTDFFHCFVVEMSTLTRENGTTTIKILAAEEVEGLIKDHEQVKAEEAKQAATKK